MQRSRLEERGSLSSNRRTSSVLGSYQHERGVRHHRSYHRDGLDQLSQSLIALKGPAVEHNRPARWNTEPPAKPLRVTSCGWNHDAWVLPLMQRSVRSDFAYPARQTRAADHQVGASQKPGFQLLQEVS